MSAQCKTPTVDAVMEAWQRDAKPPTWAQIVAMKQEHAELRETAARQASLLRGCYARINWLEKALATAHDHIDMATLEVSHCKDAATIRAALEKKHEGT